MKGSAPVGVDVFGVGVLAPSRDFAGCVDFKCGDEVMLDVGATGDAVVDPFG